MLVSQKLAIAAHLHVLLRRKTGRVTDTEWMASNSVYAAEIIRFARAKALEDGHPDLAEWAGKLEHAVLGGTVPSPFDPGATSGFGVSVRDGESGFSESTLLEPDKPRAPRGPNAPRYVGGIR